MSYINHKIILGGALAVSGAVSMFSLYKLFKIKQQLQKDDVYETKKSLSEYLLLHYGLLSEAVLFDEIPKSAVDFPKRCAELCIKFSMKADVSSLFR